MSGYQQVTSDELEHLYRLIRTETIPNAPLSLTEVRWFTRRVWEKSIRVEGKGFITYKHFAIGAHPANLGYDPYYKWQVVGGVTCFCRGTYTAWKFNRQPVEAYGITKFKNLGLAKLLVEDAYTSYQIKIVNDALVGVLEE